MTLGVPRRPTRAVTITFALVAVYLIYVTVVVLYAVRDRGDAPDGREPAANGALVYLDIDAVSGETFSLQTRASVYPGSDLLDGNGDLRDALTVEISPAASDDTLSFPRGSRSGSQPVSLYADGDIRAWPFDHYRVTGLQVRVFTGSGVTRAAVPVYVAVTDSVSSWSVTSRAAEAGDGANITIDVDRSGATTGFGIALCMVLVTLPICTLFVSIQTLRRRKQFLPPIVTWFAVMLFAVLPIRNLFPGSPPIGSWVDYTVVLWVVMGLAVSLVLYVTAWWRQGP